MHLNEELFEQYKVGDPSAVVVHSLVDTLTDALGSLLAADVCPDCIVNHVSQVVGQVHS